MKDVYLNKAALPRSAKNAPNLREALARWGTDRLLNVVDANRGIEDKYRKEFGATHRRYANMTFLITEAITNNNLKYTAETLLHWIYEDFNDALTSAQKDAAGICAAELSTLIELYKEK